VVAESKVSVADRIRRPFKAALDAVAASWTIESEEEGESALVSGKCASLISVPYGERPGVRPGRASQGRARALMPGQRRRVRRRLDLSTD
jgi:hypothetical protein